MANVPAWAREQGFGLTPFQEKFCQEYVRTGSAIEAYKRVRSKTINTMSDTYVALRSRQMLANYPKVKERIVQLQAELVDQNKAQTQRVISELFNIALSDMRKVAEWDEGSVKLKASSEIDDATAASISKIAQTRDGVKVDLWSKTEAISQIARMQGLFREQIELTGKDGRALIPENEPDELAIATYLAHCLDRQRRIADSAAPLTIDHAPEGDGGTP